MSIKTVYIKGTKKAANETLALNKSLWCTEYTPYQTREHQVQDYLTDGDVIKFYTKKISGSPYATAYGNWDAKKGRVK